MKLKFTAFGLLTVGLAILAPEAMAASAEQSVGKGLLEMMDGLLSGNLALFAGIIIALFGAWGWLIKQETWGIIMIAAGVAVTAFPGIFQGIAKGASGVLAAAGVAGTDDRATETELGAQLDEKDAK
ncbi:MAG: hypothetical protein OXR68_03770 [Alphaproteobacteria bacterium]|nr:hypothetical protein [Alphaproteobacteria bacterium]